MFVRGIRCRMCFQWYTEIGQQLCNYANQNQQRNLNYMHISIPAFSTLIDEAKEITVNLYQ